MAAAASRYEENKRAIDDKYMGPVIKTSMTRCIQCTRCIRFSEEVAGVDEIGMLYRGEDSQITSYLEAGGWRRAGGQSRRRLPGRRAAAEAADASRAGRGSCAGSPAIDVMDAVGSNIRLDVRQRQVMRILPRINEDVNEEWISDKTRHHVDALVRNRLDRPWVREKGKLREASWAEALDIFAKRLTKAGGKVAAIAGDLLDAETMYAAKELLEGQGSSLLEGRQTGLAYDTSSLSAVAFNSTIAGIENADVVLLVGSNIRWEAPLIATRVRKVARKGGKVFAIGPEIDLGMKVEWLGDDLKLLGKLPKPVTDAFAKAQRPAVIVGGGALAAGGQGAALALVDSLGLIRDGWNGYNVCTSPPRAWRGSCSATRRRAASPTSRPRSRSWCCCSAPTKSPRGPVQGRFKVYIGHHGDAGAQQADLVLPGAAYAEKHGTYVNTEGRVQWAERAVFPPGEAREDWSILRAVSRTCRQEAAVRQLRPAPRGDDQRNFRNWAAKAWSTCRGRRRSCREGGRPDPLSDRGLLPDQRDLPQQPDDAALLGRAAVRRRSDASSPREAARMTDFSRSRHDLA